MATPNLLSSNSYVTPGTSTAIFSLKKNHDTSCKTEELSWQIKTRQVSYKKKKPLVRWNLERPSSLKLQGNPVDKNPKQKQSEVAK